MREQGSGKIVGSTRFHDIVASVNRVEIGYTWYSKSCQRTHINTSCKLLLLEYAFETVGCKVVGWRTSQRFEKDGFVVVPDVVVDARRDALATQVASLAKEGAGSPTKNWLVALHQYLSIPVQRRVDSPACSG